MSVRFRRRLLRPLLAVALPLLAATAVQAAESDVTIPDCAALEGWASAIDGEDRWTPVEGSRAWVPRAYGDPAFEALFGVPALEWTVDDAKAVAARLYACGQQAAKERRMDARTVLYTARGHMIGKLRGVLLARDKAAAAAKREAERDAERRARAETQAGSDAPRTDQPQPAARTEPQPPQPPEPDTAQPVASGAGAGDAGGAPTCEDIRAWVRSADADSTFEPLPNVTLSRLFEDGSFVPAFGRPVASLERDDFKALHGRIFECRKQAAAQRRKEALAAFSTARSVTKEASRSMRTAWDARKVAQGRVDYLLAGVPRMIATDPTFFAVLEIAEKSLQGADVSADVAALEPRLQGFGRQAAELADHRPYLSEAAIGEHVARLREQRQTLQAEAAAGDEELARLLQQIAAAPVSEAGLVQLRQLHHRTETSAMTRANAEAYNRAFQARWRHITNEIQRRQAQAKQALATNPVPVARLLDRVVEDEIGPSMTVAGAKTGTALAKAASALSSRMGYGEATSFERGKQYTVTGKDLKRYTEQEGRDGGLVNLQTRLGIVGEIEYIEHFTGPIDLDAAKRASVDRFGDPDRESRRGSFTEMTWAQDGHLLEVVFGPRINGVARFFGDWRSSVQVVLRSEEFAEYLSAARDRCARLRAKPASELSADDRQAIVTGCLTP